MISKIKYEYLLLIIAVFWVFFFSFVIQLQPYFEPLGDDATYLAASKMLYFNATLDSTRPVFISAIFGLPYGFGFPTSAVLKWVFALNFLCWFFTAVLLFKIVASRCNRKSGFIIALLFLLFIGNLAHAFRFLSESLFIFLLLLSVYCIHRYFSTHQPNYITLAVSVLVFTTLVKPVAIGLTILVLLFFIRKIKSMVWNRFSLLLVLGFGLLFFQMYSLKKTYGDFTLSYIGSVTYYNYLGAKADCYRKNIEYLPGKPERSLNFDKLKCSVIKEAASKDFAEQIQNNTFNLFRAYLFCIYSNSSKGNYIVSECKNVNQTAYFDFFQFLFKAISKLQNIVFTIVGVLISFYFLLKFKTQSPLYVLLSVFVLYLFFISAISCYECDRFSIALYPMILLLLCYLYQKKQIHE